MKKNKLIQSAAVLLVLISISCRSPKLSSATNFKIEDAEVALTDGTTQKGNAEYPPNLGDSKLHLKINGEKIKLEKEQITSLTYNISGGKLVYENLKIYKNKDKNKIRKEKQLLALTIAGKVSLYSARGSSWQQQGNTQVPVYYTIYYCKRATEEAATLIHMDMGAINQNALFRPFAQKYFEDDTEIASKIKNRDFTYKNLFEVVSLYNSKHP